MKVLPYGRQSIDETDVRAVAEQLVDDWLTQGPTIARFESALCEITGARFAVAVSSGTAALHIACLAGGVGPGDTAIVPDITFVATANAVRYAGGAPVIVDVDPSSALVHVDSIAVAAAVKRPKAIIPVSFAGSTPDLVAIRACADRHEAIVIEDAAHSLGATYESGGRTYRSASCAHSDMAILSFHPVKHLTTGEGGAVTTNDEALYERLCVLRSHGIIKDPARLHRNDGPWYYEQQALGFNYRITDIQCALGLSQAAKFPTFLARRREIAHAYDLAFRDDSRLTPLAVPAGVVSAYHLYVVCMKPVAGEPVQELLARRKEVFLRLREASIAPQVHYIPIHRQPDFVSNGFGRGDFAGAEGYYAGCLSLPMYPGLSDADVRRVIDTLHRVIDA